MPKEPMLVAPLWEEFVNVKACFGINTQSNRIERATRRRPIAGGQAMFDEDELVAANVTPATT